MSLTADWLADQNAKPVTLIEVIANVSSVETTFYLSDKGFTSTPADTISDQYYAPRLLGNIIFKESLSLDNRPSIAFSDITLNNHDGAITDYADYVWNDRVIEVYHGDMTDDRDDFTLVFSGTVDSISSRREGELILRVNDKMQLLNKPLTDTVLGGATDNADELIPLSFGECFNVLPLLTNAATHEYQVHDGPIEDIVEVRDLGYPVTVTETISTGKFTLASPPAGTITASVQGDKNAVYNKTVGDMIKHIVKTYGPLTDADINLTNFNDYDTAHAQQVSYYANSKENLLNVVTFIAGSLGSQVTMSRIGELEIFQLVLPPITTATTITQSDYFYNSLELIEMPQVESSVKLGFARNYTIQPDLQTGISAAHKDYFSREYITLTQTDATAETLYKLDSEPEMTPTGLIIESEASTEATRRLALVKTQRKIFRFKGLRSTLSLTLGQAVDLYSDKYGLDSGELGVVISIQVNWSDGTTMIEVII